MTRLFQIAWAIFSLYWHYRRHTRSSVGSWNENWYICSYLNVYWNSSLSYVSENLLSSFYLHFFLHFPSFFFILRLLRCQRFPVRYCEKIKSRFCPLFTIIRSTLLQLSVYITPFRYLRPVRFGKRTRSFFYGDHQNCRMRFLCRPHEDTF